MPAYTVTELNNFIKNILTTDPKLNNIWVQGEISNLTKHSSGHYYFTIKDEKSQVSCVSFRSVNRTLRFEPERNMKVLVFGSIDVYTIRGQYQLRVLDMRPDGIGELYKAYEQLKERLEKEGLFAPIHKQSIPKFPKKIGVATSPTGAAIHDILNVIGRRYPVDILLSPTIVQGEKSAESIVRSIELLNRTDVDVIIAGRGGGSLEDLWSFNEEAVARAIFNSEKPIVSAVGHETDFTISDFTADLRAPTPSAAAELVVPDKKEVKRHISNLSVRMESEIGHMISERKRHLEHLREKIEPEHFRDMLRQDYQHLDELTSKLSASIERIVENKTAELRLHASRLNSVSPLNTIGRGYSITISPDNRKIVTEVADVKEEDEVDVVVTDGILECNVRKIRSDRKKYLSFEK
ncbi:Exodeoxyribonuclease VII large subunit [Methanococcoides methylutens MM1]|uniref:Exodeoxyribonuclease VII large subunit n=2 Tax=Methanococcoides methylutens TaxID=2226 RepID=A0A0E3X0N5_METMT|nr:exodeoxyribonuclease VII large subunit [Methanococcoides methylutens]AKB86050.1 Exodeoxyribonuclease VII large subunit [Methanococcoides methylutens MM1]